MTDYDVMNYGFTPEMAAKKNGHLVFYEEKIPSAVLGTARQFQNMASVMASYKPHAEDAVNGKPHVSDMFVVNRLWKSMLCEHVQMMKQFGEEGWEKAKLVHYPNVRTNGDKLAAIRSHP